MQTLFTAMQQIPDTVTANGNPAYSTTHDKCLDLFYSVGASRQDSNFIQTKVIPAWNENKELTMRIMLWGRDIRGGAGERKVFRDFLKFAKENPSLLALPTSILAKVPVVGRWDDLHEIINDIAVIDTYLKGLASADLGTRGLAAKWTPRKGPVFETLRKTLGLTPKQFRKFLVENTKVVETQMCNNDWTNITYKHVPSRAAKIYSGAFRKHDPEGYTKFIEQVKTGESKINAGAIFPYDVIKGLNTDAETAEVQWKALPDYLAGTNERILTVTDVSGSMSIEVSQGTTAMQVAISLGIYCGERLEGSFKNKLVTFHSNPTLFDFSKQKTLDSKVRLIQSAPWGMNTNIYRVFQLILDSAVKFDLPESEMPTTILITSDMQFDVADGRGNDDFLEVYQKSFAANGYKLPKLVFWNIAGKTNNMPITKHSSGATLVSGFSPAVLKMVLGANTPMQAMLDTVMQDRYNPF